MARTITPTTGLGSKSILASIDRKIQPTSKSVAFVSSWVAYWNATKEDTVTRTAETVGFSVTPDLVADIQSVSDYFAGGNRSAFLRLAVQDYRARMRHAQMQGFRAEAGRQIGRVLTEEEVEALVADVASHA